MPFPGVVICYSLLVNSFCIPDFLAISYKQLCTSNNFLVPGGLDIFGLPSSQGQTKRKIQLCALLAQLNSLRVKEPSQRDPTKYSYKLKRNLN